MTGRAAVAAETLGEPSLPPGAGRAGARAGEPRTEGGATTVLRGASAGGDPRRAARAMLGVVVVTLAVLALTLVVAGAQKNARITELRRHGVAVDLSVTGCRGLMGGSGSNLAGYACQGTYELGGRRYLVGVPGDAVHAPGSVVAAVAVPGDPTVFTTAATLAHEQASWRVFVLPALLVVVPAVLTGLLVARRRASRRRSARPLAPGCPST